MQQQRLSDFLNLEAHEERNIFMAGDAKTTPGMKYDAFVKEALKVFHPIVEKVVMDADALLRECKTVEEIENLKIPVLPNHVRQEILIFIDKRKLNIVEKTYLFLDLLRTVSGQIGSNIGRASMHYANAIRALSNLDGSDGGGRIIGLNGRPLKGR